VVAEAGVDGVLVQSPLVVGAHAGYRDYTGIRTGIAQLQAETPLTAATWLVATAIWEPSSYLSSTRAGAAVRMWPMASLAVEAGEGVRHTPGDTSAAVYVGLDWRLPIPGSWSVFLERHLDGGTEAGLRVAYRPAPIWRRMR
jgi:hypothetical protein